MKPAGKPPILGPSATQIKKWIDEMTAAGAEVLLEGDTDDRDIALMKLAVARYIELHVRDQQERYALQAQELGASNEDVAYHVGLRPQTTSTRFPNPFRKKAGAGARAGLSGWRKQD